MALGFGSLAVNAEPDLVRGYAEASLERLAIEVIDLYYPHWPDPQVSIEETVAAMADLVDAGLVRHRGLSNVDADQLRRAHAMHPISAVQAQWSLWAPIDAESHAAAADSPPRHCHWPRAPTGGSRTRWRHSSRSGGRVRVTQE